MKRRGLPGWRTGRWFPCTRMIDISRMGGYQLEFVHINNLAFHFLFDITAHPLRASFYLLSKLGSSSESTCMNLMEMTPHGWLVRGGLVSISAFILTSKSCISAAMHIHIRGIRELLFQSHRHPITSSAITCQSQYPKSLYQRPHLRHQSSHSL